MQCIPYMLADYHLESARVALARAGGFEISDSRSQIDWRGEAAECCEKAKELIQECGYHRRDGEVLELIS